MPVVNIRVEKLKQLVGVKLSTNEIAENLAALGISVEETGEILRIEYNPNRPDFSSVYGVARALRSFLGIKTGLPKYRFKAPRVKVFVDKSVQEVRPFIACAVVRRLSLSEEDLVDVIAMQEDLHWIIGRNRRKTAIGLHDMSAIVPPFVYKAVGFDEVKFVPLKDFRPMTPREVLDKSEIGRKHAWLLKDASKAPVIVDSRGEVFSMPPIVNASLTELTPGRRDIFVDVTGTDFEKVNQALNILTAALADAGGQVEQVRLVYAGKVINTPNMNPGKMVLDVSLASSLTGLEFTSRKAASLLRRMGMDAAIKGRKIHVSYPSYRVDILHPADLVEDISIAYGYNRMNPLRPVSNTYGRLLPTTLFYEKVSEIMVGLGYTEVHNLILTNETIHFGASDPMEHIRLANPATQEYTMVRTTLLPSILSTLSLNKDNLYPQKVFEVGDVVTLDHSKPEKTIRKRRLAAATAHSEATYSEIKSTMDELFRLLKIRPEYKPHASKPFIAGRCAAILLDDEMVGVAGEVSPQVLENIGVYMPVAAFELSLDKLMSQQQLNQT